MSPHQSVQGSLNPPYANQSVATTGPHAKTKKGGNVPLQPHPKTARQIKAHLLKAAKTVRRKELAKLADVTDETVKSWFANGNAPRFVESMRLGNTVPQIEAAIIELLRDGEHNPHHDRPVGFLLSGLVAIAAKGGESAKLAKEALARFNEARGRA